MSNTSGLSIVATRTEGATVRTLYFGRITQVYFYESKTPGQPTELIQIHPRDIEAWLPLFEEES